MTKNLIDARYGLFINGEWVDAEDGKTFVTTNPATGEKKLMGEFLINAQGEDVVAGVRTPMKIAEMENKFPAAFEEFTKVCRILEDHYRDMQDMEFTVENEKLYICLLYTSDAADEL